ncbi:MAG: ribosome assembly factor SBDS [Candidatus Aenigmarchaeota archaeon]|nr:ribosome assembly factor SBDS [Candidatus Aenigmarchaeota archaeon]
MVSVDKAVIARINKAGKKYEVLVDPELALAFRGGKAVEAGSLLAVEEVFEDVGKGTRAAAADLTKAFGTGNAKDVCLKIVKEGEVQLTTEQRRKMQEERERAVAAIISKQGVNPQTGAPHPIDRVLRAMEQAKARVSIERSAEEQVEAVLKIVQTVIPVKIEKVQVAIKIPAQYSGRGAGIVREFGYPQREEYSGDGSYLCVLELSAGMQQDLFSKLNSLTHGDVQIKPIKK